MSDSSESEDGQFLAFREAKKLYGLKPDHELMKYALDAGNDTVWEEFISRFGKPGISRQAQSSEPAMAYTYAQYFLALREACKDTEKPIVVVHCGIAISEDEIPY
ncbi:MAG: hypothetical protein WCG73_02870 [Candidatus Moraniibacteriota bacterium]